MFLHLVEENERRPWQLKLFLLVDKTDDLMHVEKELFKRRWRCIKWLPSKRPDYNYFTYVQKPKNLNREDFSRAIHEIAAVEMQNIPYYKHRLFELIESGQMAAAKTILLQRENEFSGNWVDDGEDEDEGKYLVAQREYAINKIELERFWAYFFFKSGSYADSEEYFEQAELEREISTFLPPLDTDSISLYYRMLCCYRANDFINVLKLGGCWMKRYLTLQQGCWEAYLTLPDVEFQIGDVCNILSKTILKQGKPSKEYKQLKKEVIDPTIQKYGLNHTL